MKMETKFQQRIPQKAKIDRPNLTGIPTQMKLDFEQRSGLSFDDVRVHYNSEKPAQFHALAYTQGDQIYIGPGQERSLPHELGHVIQQKAGRVRPTRWIHGQPVNDHPELEREADHAPVQCMPAPALRGVIQMAPPVMPRQRGCNCGYHALARALYTFCQKEFTDQFVKKNWEIQLTSYAIEKGYSVIGEAFDPYILAHVGNEFCRNYHLSTKCTVLPFRTTTDLLDIHNKARSGDSIFLVPYFPHSESWGPAKSNGIPNAHWGVIEQGNSGNLYKLYEGNFLGSADFTDDDAERLSGQPDGRSIASSENPLMRPLRRPLRRPLDVRLQNLLISNRSIQSQFNWDDFWKEQSPYINGWEAAVKMRKTQAPGAFPQKQDFHKRVDAVMNKISHWGLSARNSQSGRIQNVHLKGYVIEVRKK